VHRSDLPTRVHAALLSLPLVLVWAVVVVVVVVVEEEVVLWEEAVERDLEVAMTLTCGAREPFSRWTRTAVEVSTAKS
jgi:hypothetical protein